MLMNVLIASATLAQAYGAAPPSAPAPAVSAPAPAVRPTTATTLPTSVATGRALRDFPNTTISYYDIAGKDFKAIDKSLKTILADPAAKETVRPFTWDVGTKIVKTTTGNKCTIQSAKSTLTAKVRLPRLAEQAKVKKDVMARWTPYIASLENDAAANLGFLSDRLRGAEQGLVGLPCDKAGPAWNAKLETVKSELNGFIAQRAQALVKPAG